MTQTSKEVKKYEGHYKVQDYNYKKPEKEKKQKENKEGTL